jgi:hypothetical protein
MLMFMGAPGPGDRERLSPLELFQDERGSQRWKIASASSAELNGFTRLAGFSIPPSGDGGTSPLARAPFQLGGFGATIHRLARTS